MERKRSIGVTIFGILIILGSLLSLLVLFDPKIFLKSYIEPFGIIFYVLSIPLTILEIVLGVNILKLKEWARKYLLVVTWIYIVTMFSSTFVENKSTERSVIQGIKKEFRKGAEQNMASYVNYRLKSESGEWVLMKVDYAFPEKSVRNVAFYLSENKLDGQYSYEILSKEGEKIKILFFYENGAIQNVQLDTPFRPSLNKTNLDSVFTLFSEDQKEIVFIFSWNADGSVKNVNVQPKYYDQNAQMDKNLKDLSPEQRKNVEGFYEEAPLIFYNVMKFIMLGGCFLFYIATIFFFTRRKVKEQFL